MEIPSSNIKNHTLFFETINKTSQLYTKLVKLYQFYTLIKVLLEKNFPVRLKGFTKFFLELGPFSVYHRVCKVFQKVLRAIIKQHKNHFGSFFLSTEAEILSQQTNTCEKPRTETLEKCEKYVQS